MAKNVLFYYNNGLFYYYILWVFTLNMYNTGALYTTTGDCLAVSSENIVQYSRLSVFVVAANGYYGRTITNVPLN